MIDLGDRVGDRVQQPRHVQFCIAFFKHRQIIDDLVIGVQRYETIGF